MPGVSDRGVDDLGECAYAMDRNSVRRGGPLCPPAPWDVCIVDGFADAWS